MAREIAEAYQSEKEGIHCVSVPTLVLNDDELVVWEARSVFNIVPQLTYASDWEVPFSWRGCALC